MPYIKSHSNYVLRSKHQLTNDGTIWERDITTIGALNQFSPGQTPIYQSSNFIISVRGDSKVTNQYNSKNWDENEISGSVWTLDTLSDCLSDDERQDDTKIVLKQDYYDFRDFAYYGSLTELFRASVTDIVKRFPGELYCTSSGNSVFYTVYQMIDGENASYPKMLGDSGDTLVSNPFGINVHTLYKPNDGEPIKYFANGGYENYQIINNEGQAEDVSIWNSKLYSVKVREGLDEEFSGDTLYNTLKEEIDVLNSGGTIICWSECNGGEISGYSINSSGEPCDGMSGWTEICDIFDEVVSEHEYEDSCKDIECYFKLNFCKGDKIGEVNISGETSGLTIDVWFGNNNDVVYLTSSENEGIHIRPNDGFIDEFYNGCDNFEYLLMNPKSTPLYSTQFSVIHENEYGYYRQLETFEFPKSAGGYNLNVSQYGFNEYTDKMSRIGEFYDEYFTDNLYRSMTHESLKNFDWSFGNGESEGDEEEYVIGGDRFKKALRVFGREFDEMLSYIDAIKSVNTITYDQRGNLPDYFLTDAVEMEGWDVKLVIPYTLSEYYYSGGEKTYLDENEGYLEGGEDCDGQLNNVFSGNQITREFSQNSSSVIKPYTQDLLGVLSGGYFVVCDEEIGHSSTTYCNQDSTSYYYMEASGRTRYYDEKTGTVKYRIKPFTDEKEYTFLDINNEFLRRLKLNSRAIWRHKGTIDGVEMVLGMFGLKSQRWCDALYSGCCSACTIQADYDIKEYTSFAHRIEEQWDAVHQKYRIEWLNSTKAINYDNRFVSDYNKYGRSDRVMPYQGILVAYRDEYEYSDSGCTTTSEYAPYIKISPLDDQIFSGVTGTSDVTEAFKRVDYNNAPVLRRYLYPAFEQYDQNDGNPYFQMNGGWHSNIVTNSSDKSYNFQYDVDNNI